MKPKTKAWLAAIAAFVLYVAIAIVVSILFKLHGGVLWGVVIALVVAGAISAWLLYRFLRPVDETRPVGPIAGSPEAILAAARAQLTAAHKITNPKFGSLPVLLVLGPENSAKTTTVVRSGLEPELLAGDVFRGESVAPTAAINAWYSQKTVIVEAGGAYVGNAPAWQNLVKALRPGSVGSALTGKAQPPRLALVCFPCDDFYKPGSGETVPAAARAIRARLGEAAKAFGVQLPTYVVFTKADGISYFTDYVRNLSAEEAREPLGAGVLPDGGAAGTYADRVTPQLERSFDELYASLADRRVEALGREHAAEFKPGAYEFPREFAKLKPLVVDFVREIGRPSELQVSPVVRGFYFTGVQAVFVNTPAADEQPAAAAAPKPAASSARSATAVFTPPVAGVVASPIAAPKNAGATRKVPRWDFLPRVLREAVFGDEPAVRLTAAGARVGFWRRVGLGTAAAVAALFAVAFTISYSGNKELESTTVAAASGLASLPANPVDLPAQADLEKLEALRTKVDTLSRYAHDGPPLHLRWGLYAGDKLYEATRTAYFAGFEKLMYANLRTNMRETLRALPEKSSPSDDYGATYSLLKAYVITTSHPEKSTIDFLPPVLMARWVGARPIDAARSQLAQRQFETFARELAYAKPFPDTADVAAVETARTFLHSFAGSEQIYQFILAEATKTNKPVQFNRDVPGSAAYVNAPYEVPAAYTKGGAEFFTKALKTVDKYLKGESWVVGDQATEANQAQIVADLKARYTTDYVEHWRKFLASASVSRYGGLKDAASKLTILSGNASPLLGLIATASRNTAPADLPDIAAAFQSVQTVTPPAVTDKLIGPSNQPYVGALLTLQSAIDQAANASGEAAKQKVAEAGANASLAKTAALQIASNFTPNATTRVPEIVQSLLQQPITNVEPMLRNFGANEINGGAGGLCAAVMPILRKFPFAPDAQTQATFAEVNEMFKPNTGRLWKFYQASLASAVPLQGTQYVASADNVKIAPGFVTLLNRARAFGEALYANDSPDPQLVMAKVEPIPSESVNGVAIDLDGMVMRSTWRGNSEAARVTWPGTTHQAKLSANLGPQEFTIAGPYTGPWAVFQLFYQADEWKPQGDGFRVGWELRTSAQRALSQTGTAPKATVQVDLPAAAAAVLRRNFFAGAECPPTIARQP
jgi:type VI secretion system protein ImpL